MESRPSDSSVAKAPAVINTFSSASFHSRLTVSNSSSQRRLRALSKASSDEISHHLELEQPKSPSFLRTFTPSTQHSKELPLYTSEKQQLSLLTWRSLVYWLVFAYCVFSFIFFTASLLDLRKTSTPEEYARISKNLSPINEFSQPYRLSRLIPADSGIEIFHPYVSYASHRPENTEITACLWGSQEDLEKLESWSLAWQGPLSVVIVVDGFDQEQLVVRSIEKLLILREKAHIHIAQRKSNVTYNSNLFLNLARLFARTRYVVLVPTHPTQSFPDGLYLRLQEKIQSFNSSELASPYVLSPPKFIASKSSVPFAPLSPLLIEQASPIWCAERFFTASAREIHWEECLWQFWLASYGTLPTITESGLKFSQQKKASPDISVSPEELIHRRLSNRFRHESCVLAAKRLKDRYSPAKVDPRKSRWLRETCRKAMSLGVKDLL